MVKNDCPTSYKHISNKPKKPMIKNACPTNYEYISNQEKKI